MRTRHSFEAKKQKSSKSLLWILLLIIIPVLLAALVYGFVFHINRFDLSLTMQGESEIVLEYGQSFTDPGAVAMFSGTILIRDGKEIPVQIQGCVEENKLGTYELTYLAEYGRWHAEAKRTVRIVDTQAPTILLTGDPETRVLPGEEYQEEGFTAWDLHDGDLTDKVSRFEQDGTILYAVEDSSGNRTEIQRHVVEYDPVPPQITLLGKDTITLMVGTKYTEPGFQAISHQNEDLTEQVVVSGAIDITEPGIYELTYTVQDQYGNQSTATRTVKINAQSSPYPTTTPNGKIIYLTFDDGPCQNTRKLLDILKKYDVKATFFVINNQYADLIQDIVDEGHSIAVHCFSHDYKKIYASEEVFFDNVSKMQELIAEKSGAQTTLLRFPGGSSNTVSRFNKGIMTRLAAECEKRGFQYFDWNVNSGDADGAKGAKTPEEVYKNVIRGCQSKEFSVVLQHDIHAYSVNAVEKIIQWGLDNGYTFLPLTPDSPTAHHHISN